ncbi:DNA-binding response regulator [Mobilitalea sibirica]|uniref:DNA-binding response regulator n=1 Tax=Mobilitalea sibirica TaxID=1462919 RepID=A0A8J7H271_9FIRM|nr:CD3324 family protein [Mobilitalea sibirica]MBH1940787.1 DNA-binding response regulator [Mobilitalea sibirica]
MNYKNGTDILPAHLLKKVQDYVDGGLIYIPKKSSKAGWGQISGARQSIDRRNREIRFLFKQDVTIRELAERFHLGEDSIRKIVYKKKQI